MNQSQRPFFVEKITRHFKGDVKGRTFAMWGLAFKPETDDIREAPALDIIDSLLTAGAKVVAFDPIAAEHTRAHFKGREGIRFVERPVRSAGRRRRAAADHRVEAVPLAGLPAHEDAAEEAR